MAYIDKYGVKFSDDRKTLISCPKEFRGEYIIPNYVASIEDGAFKLCGKLVSVTIPDSVTSIGRYAFWYCTSLTSVAIGNGVTIIGDEAFEKCSYLKSVVIGNSVTIIGDKAFKECNNLVSVEICNDSATIGDEAFEGCNNLTYVTIPDNDEIEAQIKRNVRLIVKIIRRKSADKKTNKEVVEEQRKVRCANCKAEYLASFKFCPHCGAERFHICPNPKCGLKNLPADALFCPECGTKL